MSKQKLLMNLVGDKLDHMGYRYSDRCAPSLDVYDAKLIKSMVMACKVGNSYYTGNLENALSLLESMEEVEKEAVALRDETMKICRLYLSRVKTVTTTKERQ